MKATAHQLLEIIATFPQEEIPQQVLCDQVLRSMRTVQIHLKALERAGAVDVVRTSGKSSAYRITEKGRGYIRD